MSVKITDPNRVIGSGDPALASGSFELYVTATGARAFAQVNPQATKPYSDFQVALDASGLPTVDLWVEDAAKLTVLFRTSKGVVSSQGLLTANLDKLIPAAGSGEISSDDITDAGAAGKAVLKAADAAAGRAAIGAGTSSLALGATASTAAAGNHVHAVAAITGLQAALDAKATTTALTALADRVTALEVVP